MIIKSSLSSRTSTPERERSRAQSVKFAEESKIFSDSELYEELSYLNNSLNLWLVLVYLTAFFTTLIVSMQVSFWDFSNESTKTCPIPELINNNWTFKEIQNFIRPKGHGYCSYYDYNYSRFINMDYEEAFKEIAHEPRPNIKQCDRVLFDITDDFYNMPREFGLECDIVKVRFKVKNIILSAQVIGSFIFGILSDLYGRKIIAGSTFFICISASCCKTVLPKFYMVLIVTFIDKCCAAGLFNVILVWVIEICSKRNRIYIVVYSCISFPLSSLIVLVLKYKVYHWRYVQWTMNLFFLPSGFLIWDMPDSVRWLLHMGQRTATWRILVDCGCKIKRQYVLEDVTPISKKKLFRINFKILFSWAYRRYMYMCLISSASICLVHGTTRDAAVLRQLTMSEHNILISIAELFSFMFILPTLLFCGRKIGLLSLYLLIAVNFSIALASTDNAYILYCLLIVSVSQSLSTGMVFLAFALEIFPTVMRGTAFGIIRSTGLLMLLVGNIIIRTIKSLNIYLLTALLVICLLGLLAIVFLPDTTTMHNLPEYKVSQMEDM